MRRSTGFDRLTIEALYLRSEGLCEGCGEPLRGELHDAFGHTAHHRRPRGKGGTSRPETNGVENGLMLNADCHEWAEANREWSLRFGFLVRQSAAPAAQPVWLHGIVWGRKGALPNPAFRVLLTDDAGYRPVEDVTL